MYNVVSTQWQDLHFEILNLDIELIVFFFSGGIRNNDPYHLK
jgi:hypothetical protein